MIPQSNAMRRYVKRVQLKICVDCAASELATTRRCAPCNLAHNEKRKAERSPDRLP